MRHLTNRRETAAFVSQPSDLSALVLFFHKSRLFVIQFYILLSRPPLPLNRRSCIFHVVKVLYKYNCWWVPNMLTTKHWQWTWLLCVTCSFLDLCAFPLGGGRRCGGCVGSLLYSDYTVFLEKFTPSVFIDLPNVVNLCVVLAFSPQLARTVLFNFPVLILNMLLAHLPLCQWNMPFQSMSLSGAFLWRCSGWFRVIWRDILPWKVLLRWLELFIIYLCKIPTSIESLTCKVAGTGSFCSFRGKKFTGISAEKGGSVHMGLRDKIP